MGGGGGTIGERRGGSLDFLLSSPLLACIALVCYPSKHEKQTTPTGEIRQLFAPCAFASVPRFGKEITASQAIPLPSSTSADILSRASSRTSYCFRNISASLLFALGTLRNSYYYPTNQRQFSVVYTLKDHKMFKLKCKRLVVSLPSFEHFVASFYGL